MYDRPDPVEQLAAVAAFLREQVWPKLEGQTAFHTRVAANMLDIVGRQWQLATAAEASEIVRLRTLLNPTADSAAIAAPAAAVGYGAPTSDLKPNELDDLNRELCRRIADGRIGLDTPGLADHLWRVTLDKLAVDQPRYETYRRTTSPPYAESN